MKLFGSHINSDINEINNEIKKIKSYGGTMVQCFVNVKYHVKDYIPIQQELKKNNMHIMIHASYTINIAKDWTEHSWWIVQLIQEIMLAEAIGAFMIVIHLGKQLKLSEQEALNNMYTSMIYIMDKIKNTKIKILFETSTGQGSEMCYDMEKFAYFFNKFLKVNKDRFRICLDTCHIFQAGYNIVSKKNINMYMKDFDRLIGLRYIALVHLNDSMNSLGAKIDRHESLGKGYIGKVGLKYISKLFLINNVPLILETNSNNIDMEIKEYFIDYDKFNYDK
jgi:deoxyribonuclease-4